MKVSEIFYAIQGEGPEIGTPTVFLRLSGCNLNCKFCDSQYHKKGKKLNMNDICQTITDFHVPHITVTGGEPTLQEKELSYVFKAYTAPRFKFDDFKFSLETNGTILTKLPYNTIVISPKKGNVIIDVLKEYAKMSNTYFKFVYENGHDRWWEQVIDTACIPYDRVYIMPEGQTREEQVKKMPEVIEYCKSYKFKFSARLHVLAFDKKRGV